MTEMKRPGRGLEHRRSKYHQPSTQRKIDMRKITHRKPVRYGYCVLPLFAWASAREFSSLTIAGRWLHRRYKVPRELANLVSELAGISQERNRCILEKLGAAA